MFSVYHYSISISFGINAPDAQCTLLYATSLTFSNNDAANAHPNYDMMHSNSCASVINIAIASGAHCTAAIACCCKQSTQCLTYCCCTQIIYAAAYPCIIHPLLLSQIFLHNDNPADELHWWNTLHGAANERRVNIFTSYPHYWWPVRVPNPKGEPV